MKTKLDMAETRLRRAIQEALNDRLGSAHIQAVVAEECVNAVDYPRDEGSLPIIDL